MHIFSKLALATVIVACSSGALPAAQDGAEIVQSVCTRCHSSKRICRNLGQDTSWWMSTAGRMIKNGAPITEEERGTVASHLSGLKPGDESVCR